MRITSTLPQMIGSGADSLKVEGRQRTRTYVSTMTAILREAIDRYYDDPEGYYIDDAWMAQAAKSMEGMKTTYGSYIQK